MIWILLAFATKQPTMIECDAKSRHADFCAEIYAPVCGAMEKGTKTFSNACYACKDPGVKGYSLGECFKKEI